MIYTDVINQGASGTKSPRNCLSGARARRWLRWIGKGARHKQRKDHNDKNLGKGGGSPSQWVRPLA